MPRTQDFTKSTIYHIRHIETKKVVYVGSTTNFMIRKSNHKYCCTNPKSIYKDLPIYQYINSNGGWFEYEVVPVLHLSLKSKTELLIEEQKEIDKHDTLYNKQTPLRTATEWYQDNKERISQQHKEYYQANKERLTEYYKEKIACECGCIVSRSNISAHLKTMKHRKLLKI